MLLYIFLNTVLNSYCFKYKGNKYYISHTIWDYASQGCFECSGFKEKCTACSCPP